MIKTPLVLLSLSLLNYAVAQADSNDEINSVLQMNAHITGKSLSCSGYTVASDLQQSTADYLLSQQHLSAAKVRVLMRNFTDAAEGELYMSGKQDPNSEGCKIWIEAAIQYRRKTDSKTLTQ